MGEIELTYDNETELLTYPQTWNELSLKQLLYIADLWQSWQLMAANNISLLRAKAMLAIELLNGNTFFNKYNRVNRLSLLENSELFEFTQICSFVFDTNTLTNCPLPMVRIGFKKYYAPNNKLSNIKGFEFSFADFFFMDYHANGTESSLDNLIACLYRPHVGLFDKTGETRVPFNHKLIDKYAKRLKKLPYAKKQLILLWYMGCRENIVLKNKDIFSADNQNKARGNENGWLSLIMAMSGDKFGVFEQTGNTDFSLLLMELREMKARTPKKTNE